MRATRIKVRGDRAGPSRQYALWPGRHVTSIENSAREAQMSDLGILSDRAPGTITIESLRKYLPPGYPLDDVVTVG